MNLFRYLAIIMRRQSLFRLVLSVLITAISLAVFSSTALGVVVETDYVKINNGVADFGSGFHSLGSPTGNGVLTFDYNQSSGQLIATGRVRGTLYWDSLFSGGVARFRAIFRDRGGNILTHQDVNLSGVGGDANNSANQKSVDVSFSDPTLDSVIIETGQVVNGAFVGVAGNTYFSPIEREYAARLSLLQFCGFFPCTAVELANLTFDSFTRVDARVIFTRTAGIMEGTLNGELFGDNSPGRLDVAFRTINGALLDLQLFNVAANSQNPLDFPAPDFSSGSLWQIQLTVDRLNGFGAVLDSTSKTFDFNGPTGNFTLDPSAASVAVHERLNYAFTWTVPEPRTWHDLQSLQLRIRDGTDMILWMRWEEATNTISLFNEASGKFGPGFKPGSPNKLQSAQAALNLAETTVKAITSVLGTGPTSPSVQLNLALSFKPSATGRTFVVEVAASDDLGHEDPFTAAGTLTVAK